MGIVDLFGAGKVENVEEKLVDKQITAGQQQSILENSTSPSADVTFLEQNKEREDLVKWQQDLHKELVALEHDLKREEFDGEKWKPMQDYDSEGKLVTLKPSCNELAIQMIRTNIRPLLSRNMIMSNFQENRILQILKRTMQSIVRNICLKHDLYNIDYFDISYIITTIKNYIMPGAFRSLNNGERKFLSTVNRRVETYNESPTGQPKKKGILF